MTGYNERKDGLYLEGVGRIYWLYWDKEDEWTGYTDLNVSCVLVCLWAES